MIFETFLFAAAKIGGFAILGRFIDFLMNEGEKKKLCDWLETWWYRFNEVQWRGFGHVEAQTAIHYFDKLCGARFFSLRRAIATVLIFWYGAIKILTAAYAERPEFGRSPFAQPDHLTLFQEGGLWWGVTRTVATLLVIALALSLTRFLSTLVLRVSPRYTAYAFVILLGVHVALYELWTPVVHVLVEGSGFAAMIVEVLIEHGSAMKQEDYGNFLDMFYCPYLTCIVSMASAGAQVTADSIINGGRIAFAAIFVLSYVARPLVQRPISRIWARVIETKKPIFTVLLGTVGTLIVLWQEFLGWLH